MGNKWSCTRNEFGCWQLLRDLRTKPILHPGFANLISPAVLREIKQQTPNAEGIVMSVRQSLPSAHTHSSQGQGWEVCHGPGILTNLCVLGAWSIYLSKCIWSSSPTDVFTTWDVCWNWITAALFEFYAFVMALKATLTPHKPRENYGESGQIHVWLIVLFKMWEESE